MALDQRKKVRDIKARLTAKEELQPAATAESATKEEAELSQQLDEASSLIDRSFENICFDMSEEEAKARVMNLVHHMIGMANEIRIMSNARITEACELEKQSIEKQKDVEKFGFSLFGVGEVGQAVTVLRPSLPRVR